MTDWNETVSPTHAVEDPIGEAAERGIEHVKAIAAELFEACEVVACAQARIIQLTTPHTMGIARLSGFALHDQTIYAWPGLPHSSPAPGFPPSR